MEATTKVVIIPAKAGIIPENVLESVDLRITGLSVAVTYMATTVDTRSIMGRNINTESLLIAIVNDMAMVTAIVIDLIRD